jgi:hypothetical protein
MTQQRPLTEDEEVDIILKSVELRDAGDEEGAHKLLTLIPLPSWLAKIMKEKAGADFLIGQGYNLSEAEAEFGPDWLTR